MCPQVRPTRSRTLSNYTSIPTWKSLAGMPSPANASCEAETARWEVAWSTSTLKPQIFVATGAHCDSSLTDHAVSDITRHSPADLGAFGILIQPARLD